MAGTPIDWQAARGRWIVAALLALATYALYSRTGGYPFIYFDDNRYLAESPQVRAGLTWSGAAWAFTTLRASNWHPLTWLSHMLDVELFGMNAGAHHLVNAGLHAANAALLFAVLARMTGAVGRSAFVAALFAVHPLHVESVAWIAERKDVLSTLLGLLALLAWERYARRPGVGRYLAAGVAFALSLMAKPMWVTLPFLLALLDVWPLRRLRGWPIEAEPSASRPPGLSPGILALEKIPMLLLSIASSAVTVFAQSRGGAITGLELGLGARLGNAAVSYATYLFKIFWPSSLAIFYPHPKGMLPLWQVAGAIALLALITGLALRLLRPMPWLAVGWFWFLGMLVPVLGIVQVGGQAMADRYTYVPAIGVFVAVAWLAERAASAWRVPRAALAGAAAAAVALLSGMAWLQIGLWADHERLFEHAIAVTQPNGQVHGILSQGLRNEGKLEAALAHALEAVRLDPTSSRHWQNLGVSYRDLNRFPESREALLRAVEIDPKYAIAWANLGQAEADLGNLQEAMAALQEALRLSPAEPQAIYGLGQIYVATVRLDEAARAFQEAVRLKPDYVAAWTQLAILQERAGRAQEAGDSFRSATVAAPENPTVWRNLGVYLAKYGEPERAMRAFQEALRRRPGDADVLYRLGIVLASQGRTAEALGLAGQLEAIDPARAGDLRAHAGAAP